MLLSATFSRLLSFCSHSEAIDLLQRAGFDAYDMPLFDLRKPDSRFAQDDYREFARSLRNYSDSRNIVCNQAHAPFPSSTGDPEEDAQIFQNIVRSMEIASILGAKCIVVHPCQHLKYSDHPEELKEINFQFYSRLIPYCEQFQIKVAIENMWQFETDSTHIIDSTCARAAEFCEYVDMLDSEWIVACLDIGHAALVGESIPRLIHALGDRLQALHVHDNNFLEDQHSVPYHGKIPMTPFLRALKEVGYPGDLTMEVIAYRNSMPESLASAAFRYLGEIGSCMIKEFHSL